MHADINQEVIAELMKNRYIEDEIITKGFFIFEICNDGVSAPAKSIRLGNEQNWRWDRFL